MAESEDKGTWVWRVVKGDDSVHPVHIQNWMRRTFVRVFVMREAWMPRTKKRKVVRATAAEKKALKAACATIGELVLINSALDDLLNKVIIEALHMGKSAMIEPVIGTLDAARKIEILKRRAAHVRQEQWRKGLIKFAENVERVNRQRNTACHSMFKFENGTPVLIPVGAAQLLKNLHSERQPISALAQAIRLAESTLAEGINLISNFERVNAALAEKQEKKRR
jgi:hypothetical protein